MLDVFQLELRPVHPEDKSLIAQFIIGQWGEDLIVSKGKLHRPSTLPGFIIIVDDHIVGLVTYRIEGGECEIVTIDATQKFQGLGTKLLNAVKETAQASGCHRLWLITTNDNLVALRFYQRRGFVLADIHVNALEKSRELKPNIPKIGMDGIPIRDEIKLEMDLTNND